MIDDKDDAAPKKQTHFMYICPQCGKTVRLDRKYCNCHADIRWASVMESEDLPEVGPCNFESPILNCSDCPEGCMYCASFGLPKPNKAGFGGQDCQHKKIGTAQCYCCQSQVKIAMDMCEMNFSQLISEVLAERRAKKSSGGDSDVIAEEGERKNIYLEAADVINEQMTRPIVNRINQKWKRVG